MIEFKFDSANGFWAIDHERKLAEYAYPTSIHAQAAKKTPATVAEQMLRVFNGREYLWKFGNEKYETSSKVKVKVTLPLTPEEKIAIQKFAAQQGKQWKAVLTQQWEGDNFWGTETDFKTLREVKEKIGYIGLKKLKPADWK